MSAILINGSLDINTCIPNRHMKTYCTYNENKKDILTCSNTTDTSNKIICKTFNIDFTYI